VLATFDGLKQEAVAAFFFESEICGDRSERIGRKCSDDWHTLWPGGGGSCEGRKRCKVWATKKLF